MKVTELRCEYLSNPLGIDVPRPRLSWCLESAARGERQTAYRVLVASTPELLAQDRGDLWDSGRIASDQSVHVAYAGLRLRAFMKCHWKVRAWDQGEDPTDWSAAAQWDMGPLKASDWKAQWISTSVIPKPVQDDVPPSPILRKEFALKKAVRSARAYVSGLGYYELFINGRRIGDHVLDPGFTKYDVRALYVTHDVTGALTPGLNAIGVMLGNGWYNCHTKEVWNFQQAPWRDRPKMMLQLRIEFTDGTIKTVSSDLAWKASTGPIVFDGLRNGETYDARQEKPGWDLPGYDDRGWDPAQVMAGPGGVLCAQVMPPIKIIQTLQPAALTEVKPGVFVYDLGQAFSGWAQLTVAGAAGTTVKMKYAEKLTADGDIDQSNLNGFLKSGECQTDTYILKGAAQEVWEPRFTYHGFRYVQVTGFPGIPTVASLRGRVVHTALEPRGSFACSNDLLNKLQRMILWSTLSNYHSIPTDCPHREKNGWTGDAQLSAEQVLYNLDAAAAYTKWMNDFRDVMRPSGQLPGIVPTGGWGYNWGSGPPWDSAYVLIPWYLYRYCGDTRILEEHYEGIKRYVDFMTSMATDHIVSFGLHDWCYVEDGRYIPPPVTSTGYYYADARILAEMAKLLGKPADEKKYARLAGLIRKAFVARFYDPATGSVLGEGQTALACALYQGFMDPPHEQKVLAALVAEIERKKRHIDCGILGTQYVMQTLHRHDRDDLAYAIATQTDHPGWGYWIAQGATTLWEEWRGNSSRLHHMFSDIGSWFYKALAGIEQDPRAPGFKRIVIRPTPVGDLTWVQAEHRSMYGVIRSAWKKAGNSFVLEVVVPPNTTATVYVPAKDASSVLEGKTPAAQADGVRFLRMDPPPSPSVGSGPASPGSYAGTSPASPRGYAVTSRAVFEVGAGSYWFEAG